MRDSHPAEKLSTDAHYQRGYDARGTGFHRPWIQDADEEPPGNAVRSLERMAHTAAIVPFWRPGPAR